jgi:hypothetical protein
MSEIDYIPLLRAQSEMIETMRQALHDIKEATRHRRQSIGFDNSPTAQELQERLDVIAAIVGRNLISAEVSDQPPFRPCLVRYPFAHNGPWNYWIEQPPEGVHTVAQIGYHIDDDERHHLIASDLWVDADGVYHPVRCQHYPKDGVEIVFLGV